jgi:hypothetical protein
MRPEFEMDDIKKAEAPKSAEEGAQDLVEEQEEAAPETAEESKARNYWWLALGFLFLFLAGGGYYALTSMKSEAHKLVGGDKYNQLSANSAAYTGGKLQKADNYFSSDEEDPLAAKAAAAEAASADSAAKPGLEKGAKPAALAGAGAVPGSSAGGRQDVAVEEETGAGRGPAGAVAGKETFEGKLLARAGAFGGRGGPAAAKTSAAAGGSEPYQPGGTATARPSTQRETAGGKPQQAGKAGVLDALKGAFRASFYGARIASNDSARGWIARSFDNTPDAGTSLEYDEKVKASLDRVNPNSIPQFLRDQDISAAEAKTLASADVGQPKMDVEGTKEALKNDQDYQAKKMAKDMAAGAMNPLGNFVGANTGRSGAPDGESAAPGEGRGVQPFSNPEDEAAFGQLQLEEYVQQNGFGGECGCTAQAPCCCLPQNTAKGNCPMYGPFLPNDPCGNYSAGVVGDFPQSNTGTMWV